MVDLVHVILDTRPTRLSCALLKSWEGLGKRLCFNPFIAMPLWFNAPVGTGLRRRSLWLTSEGNQAWSFLLFVFSITGGMGTTATVVYKWLASVISEMYEKPTANCIQWIGCNYCAVPSCACVDLDLFETILITTPSVEALLTLPAEWVEDWTAHPLPWNHFFYFML